MSKEDFKKLMILLYSNNQLFIPNNQSIDEWIDNCYKEQQSEWISIKDELPNTESPIIISGEEKVMFGYYYKGKFRDGLNINREVINITHWQPLPQPPKQTDN